LLKKAKKQKGIAGVVMWTTNLYFDSVIRKHFDGVKYGFVAYITTPVIPSCFLAFFSDPYSLFENFNFLNILVCVLFFFKSIHGLSYIIKHHN